MLGITNIGGGGGKAPIIKSVQRGVRSGTNTAQSISITINTVDPDKCMVIVQGGNGTDRPYWGMYAGYLSNSTTLVLIRHTGTTTSSNVELYWEVVEFTENVSVQRGITAVTTSPVTISEVDLSKAFVYCSGTSPQTTNNFQAHPRARLLTSTTLGVYYTFGLTAYWFVVEMP